MLAGDLEAFPVAWFGPLPDLMGQKREGRPDLTQDPAGHHEWFIRHNADDMRVMRCAAATYWAQRARDLKAEELATAAVATVASGHPGAWERATTAQLVGWGVEGWLRRLAGAKDPERLHWELADRVLKGGPEAGAARVRDRLGRALCDAVRELAAAVLPAFLVPDLDVEDTAARAAAEALAWLEPRALPGDADLLRGHFSERLEAYRAAVGGPIVFADRVPLVVSGFGPDAAPPDGGWFVAPGGWHIHRARWDDTDGPAPVQPGEPAPDERWGAPGGAELWLLWLPKCSECRDSLIVRIVADATLARVRAEMAAEAEAVAGRRKPALHRGVVEGIMRAAGPGAVCVGGRILAPLEPDGRKLSAVPMVAGATDWVVGGNGAAVLAVQLAAWLAGEAHQRWVEGKADPDRVVLPAGRDALSRVTGGIRAQRDEIEAALEWLRCVGVASESLIYGWDVTREREPSQAGGRPAELIVVRVGEMLWPWRGLEWWERHPNLKIPERLRWLSPVLPVADAPLVGYHQTRGLQRSVWSLGMGAVLIDRREEYAERGGVEWATVKAGVQRLGLWERTHNSLAERWLEAACEQPKQLSLAGRAAPLERFELEGRTLVRLGPDYADAAALVMGAADRTKAARDAQKRGASKRWK